MNNRKKAAIFMSLAIVIGFSSYEFYSSPIVTQPVWKQNPDSYDSLSVSNTSLEVNISQGGQELSTGIYIDTKEAPWKKNDTFYMTIYSSKISQNLSAPYTDSTAVISNVSVSADGSSLSVTNQGVGKIVVNNSSMAASYFGVTPGKSMKSVNATVSFNIQEILFVGFYHMQVKTDHVVENISLH